MTIGVHMCRGNAYVLEYDTERAGGFEPLRFVPKGKKVVLGLASTKTPLLESKDVLKRKIEAAAKFVRMENLSLSPQCGFASPRKGTGLALAGQKAKLELVAETATDLWGES